MSFTYDVKKEVYSIECTDECCIKAQYFGYIMYSGGVSAEDIYISSDNVRYLQKLSKYLAERCKVVTEMRVKLTRQGAKKHPVLRVPDEEDRKRVLCCLENTDSVLERECCTAAFLRGVFLVCATVSDPGKGYHLEFSVHGKRLAELLISQLERLELAPNVMERRDSTSVYIKGSQSIADFFGYIGATKTYFSFFNVIVEKEVRNSANRRYNCDNANLAKTVNASASQIVAIKKLIKNGKLELMDTGTQRLAALRLEHPEATLAELAEMYGGKTARSTISRRLRSLIDAAENLNEK